MPHVQVQSNPSEQVLFTAFRGRKILANSSTLYFLTNSATKETQINPETFTHGNSVENALHFYAQDFHTRQLASPAQQLAFSAQQLAFPTHTFRLPLTCFETFISTITVLVTANAVKLRKRNSLYTATHVFNHDLTVQSTALLACRQPFWATRQDYYFRMMSSHMK